MWVMGPGQQDAAKLLPSLRRGGAASSGEEPNAHQRPPEQGGVVVKGGGREGPQAARSQPQKATSWTCCGGGVSLENKGPISGLAKLESFRRERGACAQPHPGNTQAHRRLLVEPPGTVTEEDFLTETSEGPYYKVVSVRCLTPGEHRASGICSCSTTSARLVCFFLSLLF